MKKYVDRDKLQEFTTKLTNKYKTMFSSPLVAGTVAEMTDTSKVYVYTGSEEGYTSGNWYYYDGSAWVSGGVYNAVAFETDKTLSLVDRAADAKAVGDSISGINTTLENIVDDTFTLSGKAADAKLTGEKIESLEQYTNTLFSGNVVNGQVLVDDLTGIDKIYYEIYADTTNCIQFVDENDNNLLLIGKFTNGYGENHYFGVANVPANATKIKTACTGNADVNKISISEKIIPVFAEVLQDNLRNPYNWFDKSGAVAGWAMDITQGKKSVRQSGASLSNFIQIPHGSIVIVYAKNYISSRYGIGLFGGDQTFISGYVQNRQRVIFIMPDDADLIRISMYSSEIDDIYINVFPPNNDLIVKCGNLYNKKAACFGDSITWYDGNKYTWGKFDNQICEGYENYMRENGMIVSNLGISGATMPSIYNSAISSFDASGYDVVIISAGVNDTRLNVATGEIADFGSEFNTTTFIGALQASIEHLLSSNDELKIILLTPTQGRIYEKGYSPAREQEGIVELRFAEAMKEVGEYYGLPVCDLYGLVGINKINALNFMNDPDPDKTAETNPNTLYSVHPTPEGYKRISDILIPFLKNVI